MANGFADWWENGPQSFFRDSVRNINNAASSAGAWLFSQPQPRQGEGAGDQMARALGWGEPPRAAQSSRARPGGGTWEPSNPSPAPVETPLPRGTAGYISDAQRLIESLIGNQQAQRIPDVSYDPLRSDARQRASDYDAKLAAMYAQLGNSIRADAPTIRDSFQDAIDSGAQRSRDTQGAIQGASDAADQRNVENLRALGIGEAAGQIVREGRDLNSDTARAVSDAAQRGQIQGDQLATNQQASLAHNTNLAGAAELEGASQRSRIGQELSSLLASYDMAEQQANQGIAAQNASSRSSALSSILGLAGQMSNDAWRSQNYQDELSRYLYEQQAAAAANQPMDPQVSVDFLQELLQTTGAKAPEDINAYLEALLSARKFVG